MKKADLHIHTVFSDSTLRPKEVIDQAFEAKLDCVAVTDHDTIEGIKPTREIGVLQGIEVIAGIELSTELNGRDVHILGYCFDESDKKFIQNIERILDSRTERMKMMIKKLEKLGVGGIEFDEVKAKAASRSIGRPHLAQVMLEKGIVSSMQEAFDKYLADDAPAYASEFKQTPIEGIQLIKEAGGISVLAHPMVTRIDEVIPSLVEAGLDGIEVYYPNTSETIIDFYENLAGKYKLLMTGGSDAHGTIKTNTFIGKMSVPYALVEQLKEKAAYKV